MKLTPLLRMEKQLLRELCVLWSFSLEVSESCFQRPAAFTPLCSMFLPLLVKISLGIELCCQGEEFLINLQH